MATVALMASSGGYYLAMWLSPRPDSTPVLSRQAADESRPSSESMVGKRRPDFTLSDSHGKRVSASDFAGKILLLNFWATWCKPCVEEMPMLSDFQQEHAETGLRVVGIALDDPENASEFARELAVGYPILVGLTDVMLVGREYGNRAGMLPYSVLVDAGGTIRWTRLGVLSKDELKNKLDQILSNVN
jgi:thiol-disulfide isomerase/thioredoxin